MSPHAGRTRPRSSSVSRSSWKAWTTAPPRASAGTPTAPSGSTAASRKRRCAVPRGAAPLRRRRPRHAPPPVRDRGRRLNSGPPRVCRMHRRAARGGGARECRGADGRAARGPPFLPRAGALRCQAIHVLLRDWPRSRLSARSCARRGPLRPARLHSRRDHGGRRGSSRRRRTRAGSGARTGGHGGARPDRLAVRPPVVPGLSRSLALVADGDTDAALEAANEASRMTQVNGELVWRAEALRVLGEVKRAAGAAGRG